VAEAPAAAPANFVDTIPVGEPNEAGNAEREGRRRRRRRGGGRRDEPGFESAGANGNGAVDLAVPVEQAPLGVDEPMAEPPRRERERRDERPSAAPLDTAAAERSTLPVAAAGLAGNGTAAAAAPVVSRAPAVMPSVPSFELPLSDLQQLADGAGLQWVHSDVDKVQAVQQAIAAEPKPAHVPRERRAVVLSDDGPLVLVETRKDLSQITLPFERQPPTQAQPRE
jgi:ribonuclease E